MRRGDTAKASKPFDEPALLHMSCTLMHMNKFSKSSQLDTTKLPRSRLRMQRDHTFDSNVIRNVMRSREYCRKLALRPIELIHPNSSRDPLPMI